MQKNQFISPIDFCDTADSRYFRVPSLKKAVSFFDHNHLKIIKVTFSFPEFVPTHQKSVYSIHSSNDI